MPFTFPIRLPAIPGGHSIIQAQSPFESQSSLSKYGRKNLLDAPYPELGILNAIHVLVRKTQWNHVLQDVYRILNLNVNSFEKHLPKIYFLQEPTLSLFWDAVI